MSDRDQQLNNSQPTSPSPDTPSDSQPDTQSAQPASPDTDTASTQQPEASDADTRPVAARDQNGQPLSLKTCAHSEIGPVRKNNQDSAYYSPTMLVVADGMGGAAAGDLASSVAIHELRRGDGHHEGDQMLEAMAGCISRANDKLADLIAWDHTLDGMGTTVCGAMFSGTQLGLIHIGDSRGYLLRNGNLTRLTHDHSWVQSLVDDGKITEEEAAVHPHRSLLLKVLNGQPSHEPDYKLVDVKQGDRLLFCSDGLCGLVDDRAIRRILRMTDPQDAVDALVDAAHQAGGYDNITVIVSDVVAYSDALAATQPETLGAAATVEVPRVDPDIVADEQPTAVVQAVVRPAKQTQAINTTEPPPEGLIDPDAHEDVRYTPMIGRRQHRWPVILSVLVAILLLIVGLFGAYRYAMSQFYIAPSNGQVSIYKGLPDVILGHSLGSLVEERGTEVEDLPVYYAQRVENAEFRASSLDQAQTQADYLAQLADACIEARQNPSASPSDSPSPSGESSQSPEDSATATITSAPSVSASSATAPSSIPITGSVNPQDCG